MVLVNVLSCLSLIVGHFTGDSCVGGIVLWSVFLDCQHYSFFVVCNLTVSSLIPGYDHVSQIGLHIGLCIDILARILEHGENMYILAASGNNHDIMYCIMVS